jgi:hypothetical protein
MKTNRMRIINAIAKSFEIILKPPVIYQCNL